MLYYSQDTNVKERWEIVRLKSSINSPCPTGDILIFLDVYLALCDSQD